MPSFEEIQDKGLLAAKGLQALLMEGIGAVGQGVQATGRGLSSMLQKPVQQFKTFDPYTRAEIGGLVGQVLGEAVTGREAPRTAEAIRQVPSILRERKEQQQQQQLEKVKLLQERQAEQRKEERAELKEAREERKLQSELIKRGQVELNQENVGLVENIYAKPYGEKYINVSEDTGKAIFNQKKYEEDLASAEADVAKAELEFEKMDNVLNAIDNLLGDETSLSDLGNALTATGTGEALIERGARLIGTPKQITAMTYLDQIKANSGFKELQEMRDASPTGGALGAISEGELDLLITASSGIKEGMNPKEFYEQLIKMKNSILKIKKEGIQSVDDILSKSVKGKAEKEKTRLVYNPNTGEFE